LEQPLLHGLAQADAGVGYVESQERAIVEFLRARVQAHRTVGGEFERVVDEA
jgi:hypothetical protein